MSRPFSAENKKNATKRSERAESVRKDAQPSPVKRRCSRGLGRFPNELAKAACGHTCIARAVVVGDVEQGCGACAKYYILATKKCSDTHKIIEIFTEM